MSDQTTTLFRCVCGSTVDVVDGVETACTSCGRSIALQGADAATTISLDAHRLLPTQSADDYLHKSIDHFTIVDRLGEGGMGTVYRALDESLQRYVALKVIHPSKNDGGKDSSEVRQITSLLEEARAQARVNHPNIVHVYYVSRSEEQPYLAMELVPNGTVADLLKRGTPTFNDVVDIGLQVAKALRASSKLQIVHGDIKPSNVLLAGRTVKLSDFGLARCLAGKLQSDSGLSGTPNYMAPELCDGQARTAQSDMYAFGVMLYEMTFGRLPYDFTGKGVISRIQAHQSQRPVYPEAWPTEIPRLWQTFLDKLLEKDPADRFANWDQLLKQLETFAPGSIITAGRLKRGIAWVIDLVSCIAAMLMLMYLVEWIAAWAFETRVIPAVLALLSGFTIPALVTWWIARGGKTPGKALMQLKIVDRHGLKVDKMTLVKRSTLQYLPMWLLPTATRIDAVGLPNMLWIPLWILMAVFLIGNGIVALFRRNAISLHDQLYNTRVVLENDPNQA